MESIVQHAWKYGEQYTSQGKCAAYIPELAKANPQDLGVCVIDVAGACCEYGDSRKKFTMQSLSKVPSLMFVLEEVGEEELFKRVGMEPTGDAFNSGVRLEGGHDLRPSNPMINAGAITVVGAIPGRTVEQRFNRVLDYFRLLCDNPEITFNEEVYQSEKATGDKNRALAYMLKTNGVLFGNVEEHLDVYFRLCAMTVDCHDIARLGAVLANNGKDIRTGQRYISKHNIKVVRSLMATCGMYNYSGVFATKVGIPSKSGVGGGIFSAVPGKLGIGVYGPALDAVGNSIGGLKILEFISQREELSIF